ncbi:MAG TPA: PhzF family phenazine biosynthesis protein [Dehalococcoidia bacterium]|nr:PhzF family phenazine biosynthesis protein [Dehalococcoidia bacterium]
MARYEFRTVDAFTSVPFKGNPVAVVLDADALSDEEMQTVASWTNLSETTFLCEPTPESGADYRLRIFTPQNELAFAGHPTIGTAHAYLESGRARLDPEVLRMECGLGVLAIRTEQIGDEQIIFTETPAAEFIHEFGTSADAISAALGVPVGESPPPASIYNGPTWCFVYVPDGADFDRLKPDFSAITRLSDDFSLTGFAVFTLTGADPAVRIRCFCPIIEVPEDPVTGSANGSLPTYLARYDLLQKTGRSYVSSQGREIGRDGRVQIRVREDDRVEVGGAAVTVVAGEIRL